MRACWAWGRPEDDGSRSGDARSGGEESIPKGGVLPLTQMMEHRWWQCRKRRGFLQTEEKRELGTMGLKRRGNERRERGAGACYSWLGRRRQLEVAAGSGTAASSAQSFGSSGTRERLGPRLPAVTGLVHGAGGWLCDGSSGISRSDARLMDVGLGDTGNPEVGGDWKIGRAHV